MNDKNNDVNWEIVQEASHVATKKAIQKLGLKNNDFDEIQNELICFILADTPRSRKFTRYITGDTTKEKLNKLIYSLNTDRSWLNGVIEKEQRLHDLIGFRVTRLDDVSAKEIVNKTFKGDAIDSEPFALISDKLMETFPKRHRDILIDVFNNPSVSKKVIALNHGVSWRQVYRVIAKANEIAGREWIPMFERGRVDDMVF